MSTKKTAASAASHLPADIDPEAEYRVTLTRSFKRDGVMLSPRDKVRVKGKVLLEIADNVSHAEKA